jgi:pimeloyl-ACP methyl ester carboxylesterase
MGGVPGAMRVFDWGMPLPGGYLANLCRMDRSRRRAADLAQKIAEYQDAYPGRPVHIAAQSGGTGVAVFAAEALPAGRQIDGLILLNGALSPQYDLRPALRNCRRGIINSYSPRDTFVLGWGTRIFGTVDRKFCDASGRVGFKVPENLSAEDAAQYAKLTQVEWCPKFAETCHHWGGHLSSAREEYLARYIAPWARG